MRAAFAHPTPPAPIGVRGARNLTLKEYLTSDAWEMFKELRQAGTVDVYHVNVMLKACDSSAEQRRLMEQMHKKFIMPNRQSWVLMLQQLRHEGNDLEATEVISKLDSANIFIGLAR
eukprot:gene29012-36058_t